MGDTNRMTIYQTITPEWIDVSWQGDTLSFLMDAPGYLSVPPDVVFGQRQPVSSDRPAGTDGSVRRIGNALFPVPGSLATRPILDAPYYAPVSSQIELTLAVPAYHGGRAGFQWARLNDQNYHQFYLDGRRVRANKVRRGQVVEYTVPVNGSFLPRGVVTLTLQRRGPDFQFSIQQANRSTVLGAIRDFFNVDLSACRSFSDPNWLRGGGRIIALHTYPTISSADLAG